jgi:protein ImuB
MFAVLHVADFALHAVLRTQSGASSQPAALLDDVGKRALILTCNDHARAEGVCAGQTAPQALAHCGTVRIYARSPTAEAEARAALLAAGFALSPRIEHTADGICTADLSGLDDTRGQSLLAAAVEQLRQFDLPATGGLAVTPLLALYAARSLSVAPDPASTPLLFVEEARTQASTLESKGVRIVRDPRAFLAPLPLTAADPAPELTAVLTAWGIRTLGALTALPKEDVARRLGPAGFELWERAAGETTQVLRLVEPAREFVATMEFEHEVETLEPLLFVLRRFVDRFALELATAYVAAAELVLELALTDDTKHARSFRLPEPTTRADVLFRVLHTHLEQLHTAAPIRAVCLRVEPTRLPHRQQGLFESGLRDPHAFAETLARLVAIAGSDQVGTPYVQNTHRPDAVVMESPAPVVELPAAPSPLLPLGLPLRRFRPPIPARLQTDEAGRFASVWSTAVSGEIVAQQGPWRGAGDWWGDGRAWQREEWDVELSGGGIYRLVRTKDGWWVEGEYD